MRTMSTRQRVIEFLGDGRLHRSDEIAQELHRSLGVAVVSVLDALSFLANYRNVSRVRTGKFWSYRRTDVERVA